MRLTLGGLVVLAGLAVALLLPPLVAGQQGGAADMKAGGGFGGKGAFGGADPDQIQKIMDKFGSGGDVGGTKIDPASGKVVPGKTSVLVSNPEQILRNAGLRTDAESLLDFFRERSRPKADFTELLALARQLGDASEQKRAKTAATLIGRGAWAVPALRTVLNELEDPAAAKLARHCLEWIEGVNGTTVPIAAAQLLADRQTAGAIKVLLDFAPLADDDYVVRAVKGALVRLAVAPGMGAGPTAKDDPLQPLLAALQDPLPLRRAMAAEVLASSPHTNTLPQIRKLLTDPKSQVRFQVALAFTERGDQEAVAVLIDLLAELPPIERRLAEQALQKLAGPWSPRFTLTGDDELSRKILRETWAGWWRTVDGPALLAAFRQRTLSGDELARVQALIAQLGDKSLVRREEAVVELIARGPKVTVLLREAAKSANTEQARLAEVCLRQLAPQLQAVAKGAQPPTQADLPPQAARLLAIRRPAGAATALLGFLPFSGDAAMREEIGGALKILVLAGGPERSTIIAALDDAVPERRRAAAAALKSSVGGAAHPEIIKVLKDAPAPARLTMALALAEVGDRAAVPVLIDLVATLPSAAARPAEEYLKRLAGTKAPPRPASDDAAALQKHRDAWLAWWKEHYTAPVAPAVATGGGSGWIVIAQLASGIAKAKVPVGAGSDRLVAVDRDGKVQWEIGGLARPTDFQVLPGGRILVAEHMGERVTERNMAGEIVWQAANLPGKPLNVQRLANGHTFIAVSDGKAAGDSYLMEFDPAGKSVAVVTMKNRELAGAGGKAKGPLSYLRAAYKMADGKMVCLLSNSSCIWLDATGKETKRFELPVSAGIAYFGNVEVTPKGHIVVATLPNTVAEYDANGKIVWQANARGNRATRLPNGNTLIASETTGTVVELDAAGKVVWQYQSPAGYQAVRARPAIDVSAILRPGQ